MAQHAIAIIGFSDSQGSASHNMRLAQSRAERIASLLRQRGVTTRAVFGLGRTAPVACNTTPEGQEKNRRVEIWLGPRRQ